MTNTTSPARLPKIVRFLGIDDAGEFGATTCPHCDAKGRYVHKFVCDDGTTRGAMSGCVKRFPVSKIAKEHRAIMERQAERAEQGRELASWDVKKLEAIDGYYAGTVTEDACQLTIQGQNARRADWMKNRRR